MINHSSENLRHIPNHVQNFTPKYDNTHTHTKKKQKKQKNRQTDRQNTPEPNLFTSAQRSQFEQTVLQAIIVFMGEKLLVQKQSKMSLDCEV